MAAVNGYTRKGEWLETRSPLESLPIPEPLLRRLRREGGLRESGGRVLLRLFPEERGPYAAEWMPLDILYEDDFCLVVRKPAGMAVHPSSTDGTGTLANAVAGHYEATGQEHKVRHIHRLDVDTTGPVLYAKNAFAHAVLDEAMREKRIERRYIAVVKGRPEPERGVIDLPIGKDRHHPQRRRVSRGGDRAVTRYETVQVLAGGTASVVRLQLETGRTHQIRVHLSHLGHPVWGDKLYGGPASPHIPRQALHGERLLFPHPWTGQQVEVHDPVPPDMLQLMESLEKM